MTVLDVLDATRTAWTKKALAMRVYECTCPSRGNVCTHMRDVEEEIREAIIRGVLIVSGGAGYRRTDDLEEVERYIASLEGRRESLTERIQALRRAVMARKADAEQTTWLDAA